MADWPGEDRPPIFHQMRPGRNRPRLASEIMNQERFDANGNLWVPAGAPRMGRANSDAGRRPNITVFNNDNGVRWDDEDDFRRPRSGQWRGDDGRRERSRSRVRMRTPSPFWGEREWEFERMKRFEELEKKEAEEARDRMRRLEDLDRKEEERRAEERLMLKTAKEAMEAEKRKKEEEELKKRAVAEWKIKEEEERRKKKEEEERLEREVTEGMRKRLWLAGYSEDAIEKIIRKGEKREKKQKLLMLEDVPSSSQILEVSKPIYITVRREHMEPETLDVYNLPWSYDPVRSSPFLDSSFNAMTDTLYQDNPEKIIIKKWIPEREQEILFEHTRRLRETKQVTFVTSEIKKERDQLKLVRKRDDKGKSPSRRSWIFS